MQVFCRMLWQVFAPLVRIADDERFTGTGANTDRLLYEAGFAHEMWKMYAMTGMTASIRLSFDYKVR